MISAEKIDRTAYWTGFHVKNWNSGILRIKAGNWDYEAVATRVLGCNDF